MTAALRAEWTKLRTLPGTGWLVAGAIALTIATSAIIAAATHLSAGGGAQDPTKMALLGIELGQAVIAVLAVLAVSEEYGTGMIRVTLSAMPRRLTLLGAKAVNVAVLTLAAATLAIAGCLIAGRLLLPPAGLNRGHGYPLVSISDSPTLRAATGSILYLILIALLSLGIATAIRDTAVSIGSALALLYLPPLLAQTVSDPLRRHLEQVAPMTAGLTIQSTTNPHSRILAPWTGLGILAAWSLASLLIGGLLLRLRDA